MPSLSYVEGGKPVAVIIIPKNKRKELKDLHLRKIYLHDDDKGSTELTLDQCTMFPLFCHRKGEVQNNRIAIFGKSGSGKSHFVGDMLDVMKHKKLGCPDKEIFVFSGVEHDPPIDRERNGDPPERVDIHDPDMYGDIQEFGNSICVFDDVEHLYDKFANDSIQRIRNGMLERGRHHDLDVISISHDALSGGLTKKIHSESTGAVIFPNYTQIHQLSTYLTKYIGLSKKDIERIKGLGKKSRWVYVSNTAPTYVVYEHGIYLLN
jgi:energy-coupling factor transporter ATP-binding protein EcfA2